MIQKKNTNNIIFIFILFFSVLLRIIFLFKRKDVWHDEAFSIIFSQKPLLFMLQSNDVHPPLYYLILKPILFFTSNELILRSVSLIFFIAFFVVLYLLLKKQFDYITTFLTLFFIGISPTMIYYSLEIRNYMLGMFLVVTQIYFFFKILSKPEKKSNYYFYTIFSILMLYTHYYTGFVFIVEILYLLKYFFYRFKNEIIYSPRIVLFFKPFLVIGLFSIPLIIYFFITLTKMQSMWFKDIDFGSFISTTTYQFLFPEMFNNLTLFIFMIMIISLFMIYFYFKLNNLTKFYLMFFYVPVILLWIISQFTPVYHHRFFLFYAFGLYIIVAKSISLTTKFKKIQILFPILLILFSFILLFGTQVYDKNQNKELYKSQLVLKDYLDENKEYDFIHETTFSMTPMKYYFRDYDNVDNYLTNSLTTKQLFTAGGSVVEDWERVDLETVEFIEKLQGAKEKIYFTIDKSRTKNKIIIYNNGGLMIYER